MQPQNRNGAKLIHKAASYLLLTFTFAIAYAQSPLYTSNQNQYFLHGLARAGLGYLQNDWLANTLDPTPLFSLLVELTYRLTHLAAIFYVFYALLMGVYLISMTGIVASVFDIRSSKTRSLVFLAFFIGMHSAALRFGLSRLLGDNWTYVFEDGVADQRLLGLVFQPSVFGVLLVLSIYLFLQDHPYLAVLASVAAASIHPTYLLSAAALTLAYMLVLAREAGLFANKSSDNLQVVSEVASPANRFVSQLRLPLMLGLLALAAVAPILVYVFINFSGTSAEASAKANDILVNFRIPHHTLLSWWFDATVVTKLIFISTAWFLIRKSRLFLILLVPTIISLGLTLLQLALHSYALALIFPWRLSIFLLPCATSLLLGFLVETASERFPGFFSRHVLVLQAASLAVIAAVVLIGATRFVLDLQRKSSADDFAVMAYVAGHNASDEIYLTPTKMQDFRLATGSPVYIEFKSIPYRDQDVLRWYQRNKLADRFYQTGDCSLLGQIVAEAGVTHVVISREDSKDPCPQLHPVYEDKNYSVFALETP